MEKKLKNRSTYFVKIGLCILTGFHLSMSKAQDLEVDLTSHQVKNSTSNQGSTSSNRKGIPSFKTAYSFESYLPPVGDQYNTYSCVGWATTYYGLTIVKRMEQGMQIPPFSPWSPYNRYQFRENKRSFCKEGCTVEGVLNIIRDEGVPSINSYEYQSCAIDSSYNRYNDKLFNWMKIAASTNQMKSSILNNCPVIICFDVAQGDNGNYNLRNKFIDSNGVLQMTLFRSKSYRVGGHAMCVVGFNDTISGGAFKVVNSWGKNWGKNGFCWLKYSDLDYVRSSFVMKSENRFESNDKNKFITKSLEWFNSTDSTLYLSVAYKKEGGLVNRGWFQVLPKSKFILPVADRIENSLYWTVLSNYEKNKFSESKIKCKKLYADIHNAFSIQNNQFSQGNDSLLYEVLNPNNFSENEDVILGLNAFNFVYDIRVPSMVNSVQNNIEWDKNKPLLDPYTSETIIAKTNNNKRYTVWYLEGNNIKFLNKKVDEIARLKKLKFICSENLKGFYKL